MTGRIWLAGIVVGAGAWAQDVPLDLFSSLQPKATEHVEVNLPTAMLQLAAGFLGSDPQNARIKALVAGLKGIYVRSLTFAKPGDYSRADVDKIRAQLKGWDKIVEAHEAHEDTGIYVKTDGQKIQGVVILSAEPTELTLVNIAGTIRMEDLKDLSGHFGIPDIGDVGNKAGEKKKEE
ncbi:MAG: DUF4252 domain-containing protein [Bryobacterales bacterium]|nr:DUF4252 domain-containing protein [Bryobacterales bacterium]MBV9397366.1 DUF4252 domain-containing protein [Bryobacterales bacterium]